MARITGIGGVFIAADDPEQLGRWYAEQLGITPPPPSYDDAPWQQDAGPTVFAVMPAAADHLERTEQRWALTFRVDDLDGMAARLRAREVQVDIDPTAYPDVRFASLHDPEGNPIQLWEPISTTAG